VIELQMILSARKDSVRVTGMPNRLHRGFLTVIVALALVFSTSLSATHAAVMSADMSKTVVMDMAGQPDCGGCADGTGHGGMKHDACLQACTASLAAVLPVEFTVTSASAAAHAVSWQAPEFGRTSPPNPTPPRA
jgi:hypothetical protein